MVNFENKPRYDVTDLRRIVEILRSPGGCPWDIEQTHESIRRNLLEEAYEAAEAIDSNDTALLREELGDVLMQVIFHADIEDKNGGFNLDDVADTACKKLIFRHPHVFGDATVRDSGEVLSNWDALKREEKSHETVADTLNAVARSLPGLWRAEKLQNKAAKAGYDLSGRGEALAALRDEVAELSEAVNHGGDIADELGDVLFSAVTAARFFGLDPEAALGASCEKFIRRFSAVEKLAAQRGLAISEIPPDKLLELYMEVKQIGM